MQIDGSRPMEEVAAAIDDVLTKFQKKVNAEGPEEQPNSIV